MQCAYHESERQLRAKLLYKRGGEADSKWIVVDTCGNESYSRGLHGLLLVLVLCVLFHDVKRFKPGSFAKTRV